MTDTIKLRRAYKPAKVELEAEDGKVLKFETAALPRSLANKVSELEREMFGAVSEDERVERMCEIIDLRLHASNGSKAKASTIIKKLWEADDLTYPELIGFYNDISTDPN